MSFKKWILIIRNKNFGESELRVFKSKKARSAAISDIKKHPNQYRLNNLPLTSLGWMEQVKPSGRYQKRKLKFGRLI